MTTAAILSVSNEKLPKESRTPAVPKVLVVDIGGNHVKLLVTGETQPRKFSSGPLLTPEEMMAGIAGLVSDWDHDAVSIGYPGPILNGRPLREPVNLGQGWVHFDFEAAFGLPVKIVNDAAMQAMGSYRSGRMLFLGLGTGLGTTLVIEGVVHAMELGHLPYKKGTFEDYVGQRGLDLNGKKQWRSDVADVVARLIDALQPTDVVLGGGNVKKLKELPANVRLGNNANAFEGGFRLWDAEMHPAS
jgi:polyphosphate glucokinase